MVKGVFSAIERMYRQENSQSEQATVRNHKHSKWALLEVREHTHAAVINRGKDCKNSSGGLRKQKPCFSLMEWSLRF
ncbi:hypothetical protein ACQP3F_32480, partial [Escherichia coli]